jgi:serine protease Do
MKLLRFLLVALIVFLTSPPLLQAIQASDDSAVTSIPLLPEKAKSPPLPEVFSKPQPENLEDLKAIEKQVKEVVAKVLPCTVCLRVGGASGSGVIISADGYILTAGHVSGAPGRDVSIVMPDGSIVRGKTLGGNGTMDSGLVKITKPGKYPFAPTGSSADLKKNDWCVVTGHPGGYKPGRSPVVRVGRILEINTRVDAQYLRTDCTIVGGDSGGPLFDMNGRVIGIHSRIGNNITHNLHVPIDTYRDTWARLVKSERWGNGIGRPVSPTPVGEADFRFKLDPNSRGCTVNEIYTESPAFLAGLRAGDLIKKFQGKDTTSTEALLEEFKKRRPGEEVTLEVQRGEEIVKVKFVLGRKSSVVPMTPDQKAETSVRQVRPNH